MSGQPPGVDSRPGEVPYGDLLTGLRRYLRTEGQRHLDDPNVCSVGIGHKVVDGRRTPVLSVQFIVEEKEAEPETLAALGTTPVPEAITIAGIRVPTDVLERRRQPALVGLPGPAGRPTPVGRRSRTTPLSASRSGVRLSLVR
ncbi:hypothetical protein [Geodermatophilus sp. SYSU D01176]